MCGGSGGGGEGGVAGRIRLPPFIRSNVLFGLSLYSNSPFLII